MIIFLHQVFWTLTSMALFMLCFFKLANNLESILNKRSYLLEEKQKQLSRLEIRNKELEEKIMVITVQRNLERKMLLDEKKKEMRSEMLEKLNAKAKSLKIEKINHDVVIFDANSVISGLRRFI